MKTLSLFLFLSLLFFLKCFDSFSQKSKSPRTIVAVVAHPDDETTIAPVLNLLAEKDSVYLIIATDGRFGVTAHANIPAGDSLVKVREKEALCSCHSIGIHAPIHLKLQDGLGLNGHGNFYEQVELLKSRLLQKLKLLKPDVIITFGPDGDTGHPDHRMVGIITTELLLRENLIHNCELFYFGWTLDDHLKFKDLNLGYAHEDVYDTVIQYSAANEESSNNSIRCYKSQFSELEINQWIATEERDRKNKLHFRKFQLSKRKSNKI